MRVIRGAREIDGESYIDDILQSPMGLSGLLSARFQKRGTYFNNAINSYFLRSVQVAKLRGAGNLAGHVCDAATIEHPMCRIMVIGGAMEETKEELDQVIAGVKAAKDEIEDVFNKVKSLRRVIGPELGDLVRELRDKRMSATSELRLSLTAMREIRQFFLDKDHEREIQRLEHFIELAERLRALIADGTADAIGDIILKLAE